MRRFLVVGCGGSGGATVAHLMDRLRSDLAVHGVRSLPRGWQFVHIDVPASSEPGPDGLGNVQALGGTYLGIGPDDPHYGVLDHELSLRLHERAWLERMATWAPRDPESVRVPISDGAGQYRAIGRMVTVSRAQEIRRVLSSAWDELDTPETAAEIHHLDVPGLGPYHGTVPIVLVVASMAGGAGASMALDVGRVLAGVHGLDPKLTSLFLLAPNVFDALAAAGRTGTRPNALAMVGEIVAGQCGSAYRHDAATLEALGLPDPGVDRIPFARVFPVGRFAGVERTRFGDGQPGTVCRGLGHGLAALIMSGHAADRFVSFGLGNMASSRADLDLLGWGSDAEALPWGSFGFARLSMGRDRYAEYAAQRLARSCVDGLLHGHRQPGDQAPAADQVTRELDSRWSAICTSLRLPAREIALADWLGAAFPPGMADDAARYIVQRDLEPHIAHANGMQVKHWIPAVRDRMAERRGTVLLEADRRAAELAFEWHGALIDRVEVAIGWAVSAFGLPYAVALVDRLGRHLRAVVAPAVGRLAAQVRPAEVTAVPTEVELTAARLRGVITNGSALRNQVLHGYHVQVRSQIHARAAELVRDVLRDIGADVLAPLAESLVESRRLLENALDEDPYAGSTRLATDRCVAWPSEDDARVPDRFDLVDNEVLVTTSREFPPQYVHDVRLACGVAAVPSFDVARSLVITQVISGDWRTTGGDRPPLGLLERTADWRSRAFPTDPATRQPLIPARASYDVHVRPAELLARARAFVARRAESFDAFCRMSLTDYVREAAGSEHDRRETELVDRFTEALALARPLISVNTSAVRAAHSGQPVQYRYAFSEIPFEELTSVTDRVKNLLDPRRNPMIDQASAWNVDHALGSSTGVTRIDVFGSYPNYSPLVFDSVLGPADEQWAASGTAGRDAFWRWRRTRPLDAALPMGDAERRAMVAGWFVGQLVGRIRLPEAPYTEAACIRDATDSQWVPFPHPLLTPPERFVVAHDWLPAVLESSVLAMARAAQAPVMASMRPYRLLRSLYDDSSQRPAGGDEPLAAQRIVGDWLVGGAVPAGGRPSVRGLTATTSAGERARLAADWLTGIRDLVVEDYLPPEDGGRGGGEFSVVDSRARASRTPMFRDLAPDVRDAVDDLLGLIERVDLPADAAAVEEPSPVAFLCHSSGDKEQVRDLYRRLQDDGVTCWFDEEDLLPGQDWEREIDRALKSCHFVLACLSDGSINKSGFVQTELRRALDQADRQPDGSIFLIPVRLAPCDIPDRLHRLHYVDLFTTNGYERLLRVLRPRN